MSVRGGGMGRGAGCGRGVAYLGLVRSDVRVVETGRGAGALSGTCGKGVP